MKRQKSLTSFVSTFLIVTITIILLFDFCFMAYNQHLTNTKLLEAADVVAKKYAPIEGDERHDVSPASTETICASTLPSESDSSDNSKSNSPYFVKSTNSSAEYASAIAYLSKIQEVTSSNYSSSQLALIYTILSSLVLAYGAKMLRLGAEDKEKLIEEVGNESYSKITNVENQLLIDSSISSAIAITNSATSSLQFLILALKNSETDTTLETINSSFLNNLSYVELRLESLCSTVSSLPNQSYDISGLESALSLLDHYFEIYKNLPLPNSIDDKSIVATREYKIMNMFKLINSDQTQPLPKHGKK